MLALAVVFVVAGCSAGGPPPSPGASCNGVDVVPTAGYYPALESLLPSTIAGATPGFVNSGRSCSSSSLGGLSQIGITDLHFAGAEFPATDTTGLSLVVYSAPGLTANGLADAFTSSASTNGSTNQITTSAVTIAGRPGVRIQVNNQDVIQTLIFWPGAGPDTVNGVLASGVDEAHIQAAIAAFGTR
ncbi:MAG: hypothetical protein ACHQZR_06990 [Candidatus Limnocylindrales bacterium]